MLGVVRPTPDDTLIFLGDYVDRGPDSRGVIDRLIWLTQNYDVVCLRGNHELMMTRSRKDKSERKMWLSVGGTKPSRLMVPGVWSWCPMPIGSS